MKTDKQSRHITPVGRNIFVDLGYEPTTAAALDAESRRIIAAKLSLRNSLLNNLNAWINQEGMPVDEVARVLGISSLKISDIAKMKASELTLEELASLLIRTGKSIKVQIAQSPDDRL